MRYENLELMLMAHESLLRLKELQDIGDAEYAHLEADEILMNLLIELGYEEIVAEYEKIEKWFS